MIQNNCCVVFKEIGNTIQSTYSVTNTECSALNEVYINNFGKRTDIFIMIWRNWHHFIGNITSKQVLSIINILECDSHCIPYHWLNYCDFPALFAMLSHFYQNQGKTLQTFIWISLLNKKTQLRLEWNTLLFLIDLVAKPSSYIVISQVCFPVLFSNHPTDILNHRVYIRIDKGEWIRERDNSV